MSGTLMDKGKTMNGKIYQVDCPDCGGRQMRVYGVLGELLHEEHCDCADRLVFGDWVALAVAITALVVLLWMAEI